MVLDCWYESCRRESAGPASQGICGAGPLLCPSAQVPRHRNFIGGGGLRASAMEPRGTDTHSLTYYSSPPPASNPANGSMTRETVNHHCHGGIGRAAQKGRNEYGNESGFRLAGCEHGTQREECENNVPAHTLCVVVRAQGGDARQARNPVSARHRRVEVRRADRIDPSPTGTRNPRTESPFHAPRMQHQLSP